MKINNTILPKYNQILKEGNMNFTGKLLFNIPFDSFSLLLQKRVELFLQNRCNNCIAGICKKCLIVLDPPNVPFKITKKIVATPSLPFLVDSIDYYIEWDGTEIASDLFLKLLRAFVLVVRAYVPKFGLSGEITATGEGSYRITTIDGMPVKYKEPADTIDTTTIRNLKIRIVFLTKSGEKEVPIEDMFLVKSAVSYAGRANARNIQFENLVIGTLYERNCGIPKDRTLIQKTYYKIYDGDVLLFATSGLRGNSDDISSLKFLSHDGFWHDLVLPENFDSDECKKAVGSIVDSITMTIGEIYWDKVMSCRRHNRVIDLLEKCEYQLSAMTSGSEI